MTDINEILLLNMSFLATLNDIEKVASLINNAVTDPEQRNLLSIKETQKTIERLRSEALVSHTRLSDMLD